jgi:hypothetical protein
VGLGEEKRWAKKWAAGRSLYNGTIDMAISTRTRQEKP